MAIHRTHFHRALYASLALLLTFAGGVGAPVARAGTVDISNTPPDLTKSVEPNIALTFDDSGSMANDYMGDRRPFDQGSWDGPWRCAGVIDPRVTDTSKNRSRVMNGVYFNPNNTYLPASYSDGTQFPNADDTLKSVSRDGIAENRPNGSYNPGHTNFTGTRYYNRKGKLIDNRWTCPYNADSPLDDDGGPYYYRLKTGASITKSDGSINTGALYNSSNWEAVAVPADQYQNWANWYAYYRTRNLMTRTAMSRAFAKFGDNIRVVYQNINDSSYKLPSDTTIGPFSDASDDQDGNPRRSAFFNWVYQIGASGGTPDRAAAIRVGKFFSRGLTKDDLDPYWNGKTDADKSADLSCRQNFHMLVTDGYWNETDPTKPGNYLSAADSTTLPDGTDYAPSDAVSKVFGNVAGTSHEPSMANIAWTYWAQDLEPKLDNNVPPYFPDQNTGVTAGSTKVDANDPGATDEVYWNPANDPATWQHVVQFMITLGVAGNLTYPDDLTALRTGDKQWPDPQNNAPEAVDDTWHGAVNSRGQFASASDPQSLVNKINDIISSITSRVSSSVSSSLNTSVLSVGALSYSAGYNTADWSGTVTAQELLTDGSFGATKWEAGQTLTKRTADRVILTSTGPDSGNGTGFTWSNLTATQQALLNTVPYTDPVETDTHGKDRLAWLRGDRTQESSLFRSRNTLLGAVINSQTVYVAYPASGYRNVFPANSDGTAPETTAANATPSKSYSKFVQDHINRAPTIYVGANDGMLHAFDATEANKGAERWAYVPYAVYPKLNKLMTLKNFQYVPTVDATPVTRDVFFSDDSDNSWHTILVGGLRYGGRGVYALDITDPTASESTADKKVLWEFTADSAGADAADPSTADNPANLGYTFGQPNIGRLANGKWVVLVPGGYFPSDSTAKAASNTFSSLFVLNAQTGKLIKELRTPTTVAGKTIKSYGLSSPVLGDYNNDQVDDVAFAGDLVGNLWRFDLSSEDPADWTVDLAFKPATPGDQPITVMPRLFPDPAGTGFMVVFGTGKFLGLSDRTSDSAPTQSIYGIREPGTSGGTAVVRSSLVEQTLYESSDGKGARALTDNPVPSAKGGWYIDLDITGIDGERVVVTPGALFNTNRVIITTLIPGTTDPCDPRRDGAVMVLDAATGGAGVGIEFPAWGGRPSGTTVVGGRVKNPPTGGSLPVATPIGGGKAVLPGMTFLGGETVSVNDPIWRRRSWRLIDNEQ